MASSQPTGVHYALVIFVLLTIVCGVFWILNNKWLTEAKAEASRAREEQKKATDGMNKLLTQATELKRVLGITLDDIGDDESNSNTVRGHIRGRLNQQVGDLGATTYEDLLVKLQAAIKNVSEARDNLQKQLLTEQETFQNKINEMQGQIAEQKRARDVADTGKSEAVKIQQEELTSKLNELTEERRELAKTQTALDELQAKFDGFRKRSGQEIDNLRLLNKSLTQALDAARQQSFEIPDGQIVKVDAVTRKVWIDKGSNDGLRPRTTFSVYNKDHSGVGRGAAAGAKGPEDVKGSIEITRVEDRLSEARIVDEDLQRPMTPGDPIFSPIWSAGRGEAFSFVGVADLDGDGKSDIDLINELVANAGATIDNLVDEKGRLFINGTLSEGVDPRVTERTKFLVKGKIPDLSTARDIEQQNEIQRMNELMSSLEKQAYERGVRVISLSDFLSFVGYKPQKRLFVPGGDVPYNLRAGSRKASTDRDLNRLRSSGGETSGAFSGDKKQKPKSFSGGETSRSR
ncbi:MAG: hypothetical protein EHM42_02125 [Planctomycetaceae bacterium]|nr:MAG: hypothetical protein EHM42_02125 [Planctomycetaceae bacterium]